MSAKTKSITKIGITVTNSSKLGVTKGEQNTAKSVCRNGNQEILFKAELPTIEDMITKKYQRLRPYSLIVFTSPSPCHSPKVNNLH